MVLNRTPVTHKLRSTPSKCILIKLESFSTSKERGQSSEEEDHCRGKDFASSIYDAGLMSNIHSEFKK